MIIYKGCKICEFYSKPAKYKILSTKIPPSQNSILHKTGDQQKLNHKILPDLSPVKYCTHKNCHVGNIIIAIYELLSIK